MIQIAGDFACEVLNETTSFSVFQPVLILMEMKMCYCEFDVDLSSDDENTPETTWHFKRTCLNCEKEWFGLHCIHDNIQNPCPFCKMIPAPLMDIENVKWKC